MTESSRLLATVVVPTRDNHEKLSATLRGLFAQHLPSERFELIVVDDGSSPPIDGVVAAVAAESPHIAITCVHTGGRGLNEARNSGIDAAHADLICFVDDDVSPPPEWLSNVVEGARRHPEAWCFGGPIRLQAEGDLPRLCSARELGETVLLLDQGEGETAAYVYGANMAVRRSAIESAGPFAVPWQTYGYDEIEWQDRVRSAGGVVAYLPGAWVWHRRTQSELVVRRLIARRFWFGYGSAAYARRRGTKYDVSRLWGVPGLLGHSVTRRCAFGLLAVAGECGSLWYELERAWDTSRIRRHGSVLDD